MFCKENNILLFRLPPQSSHLTQPLDVSFYKPLKAPWGKACSAQNPGYQVTKHEFSKVFHEAWISCVILSTTVNGSEEAGYALSILIRSLQTISYFPRYSFLINNNLKSNLPMPIQVHWNPSKADTIGTMTFVLYREVSLTQFFFIETCNSD